MHCLHSSSIPLPGRPHEAQHAVGKGQSLCYEACHREWFTLPGDLQRMLKAQHMALLSGLRKTRQQTQVYHSEQTYKHVPQLNKDVVFNKQP